MIKENKFNIKPALKAKLKKEAVNLAYLYGSYARGDYHTESDVDIAVLLDSKIKESEYLKKVLKISVLFEDQYPNKEIGLVLLNQISPLLKQNIIVEGKELYCANQDERILFENRALHEYEDTRHLRKIYNEVLKERINKL